MFLFIWKTSISFFAVLAFGIATLSAQARPLQIVTTLPYLQDLVKNITCENSEFQIYSLMTSGTDPHSFHFAPQDRALLKNAKIIIEVGAGLEQGLDKMQFSKSQIFFSLDSSFQNNPNLAQNPHVWQSPLLTQKAVDALSQLLIKISPSDTVLIKKCTQQYKIKIQNTVKDLREQLSAIPMNKRVIATNHNSLLYFAQEFGFTLYSLLGVSDEDSPTLNQLTNMVESLKKQNIQAVFLESTGNTKNMQAVARNAKIKIGGALYGDSLGEKGSGAETTLGMWQKNTDTLVQALK